MDGYGKRILVVGDEAGCRALLAAQLEHAGYAVHMACDGVAGLEEMRRRRFDAVITDGRMSGFSGLEFAGFCGISWPDIPVILLSGDSDYATDCVDEFQVAACIHKPYEAAMLLSVLRTVTQPGSREPAIFPMAQMQH